MTRFGTWEWENYRDEKDFKGMFPDSPSRFWIDSTLCLPWGLYVSTCTPLVISLSGEERRGCVLISNHLWVRLYILGILLFPLFPTVILEDRFCYFQFANVETGSDSLRKLFFKTSVWIWVSERTCKNLEVTTPILTRKRWENLKSVTHQIIKVTR